MKPYHGTEQTVSLGPGLILWYDLSNEKGTIDLVRGMLGACMGQVHLKQPRRRWDDNIKMDLQEVGCGVRIRSIWFRIGTGGGLL